METQCPVHVPEHGNLAILHKSLFHSSFAVIILLLSYLETSVNSFELLCVNDDSCVAVVLNFCFLVFMVLHHKFITVLIVS